VCVYSAGVLKQEYKTLQMGVFWVGLGTVMLFIGMYLLCLVLKYEGISRNFWTHC